MAVAVGALLALPSGAQATITIGSNLTGVVDNGIGGPGTWGQTALPAGSQAPGGLVSPVNGVITTWRTKWDASATLPLFLRVIRPAGGNTFVGQGTSSTSGTPAQSTITSFPTQLPISIGDQIAYDSPSGTAMNWNNLVGASTNGWFLPPLANGGAARGPTNTYAVELLINADIEPNADCDVKKPKRLKNGKVRLQVSCPNAGSLTAKAKKKLKQDNETLPAAGEATLLLKPTKGARSDLAADETVKAKIKISFTPTFGSIHTETKKTKLKP